MVDGDKAIEYLKKKLINLIEKGVINATYDESKNTVSFYISDILTTNRPLLSLRLSNHHENFNNRKGKDKQLPQGNDNLSIELYKPKEGYRNKTNPNVFLYYFCGNKPTPVPFSVTTIEYEPRLMYDNDVNLIYQSILNWVKSKNQGAVYIDPLAKTTRRANINTHQANFTVRRYVTQAEKNFYLRYGLGDSKICNGNIIESKKDDKNDGLGVITLTESDLRWMVVESVRKILAQRRMIG